MKSYSSKKKRYLCLGEQTIMKWKLDTIQIQHSVKIMIRHKSENSMRSFKGGIKNSRKGF